MLSQTVEYALRAIVHLAYTQPLHCSTSQIAEKTKVPPAYLSKVLQSLVKSGIVHSQRGVGGGMTLLVPAEKLTILDIVNAVDPIKRIRSCPLEIKSHAGLLCPLHRRMDDALALMERAFGETTLAEILAEKSNSVPLCESSESPYRAVVQLSAVGPNPPKD